MEQTKGKQDTLVGGCEGQKTKKQQRGNFYCECDADDSKDDMDAMEPI